MSEDKSYFVPDGSRVYELPYTEYDSDDVRNHLKLRAPPGSPAYMSPQSYAVNGVGTVVPDWVVRNRPDLNPEDYHPERRRILKKIANPGQYGFVVDDGKSGKILGELNGKPVLTQTRRVLPTEPEGLNTLVHENAHAAQDRNRDRIRAASGMSALNYEVSQPQKKLRDALAESEFFDKYADEGFQVDNMAEQEAYLRAEAALGNDPRLAQNVLYNTPTGAKYRNTENDPYRTYLSKVETAPYMLPQLPEESNPSDIPVRAHRKVKSLVSPYIRKLVNAVTR